MHCTAISSLAGAILQSAKVEDDEDITTAAKKSVRELVQTCDADFSISLRAKIIKMVQLQEWPDPFENQVADAVNDRFHRVVAARRPQDSFAAAVGA